MNVAVDNRKELLLACRLAKQQLIRESRNNFRKFVTCTKSDYEVNWHHALLCHYLDLLATRDITKLMVFMPPQHGKSQLVSRHFPAFMLGKDPSLKIVGVSYAANLATSFNRSVQRIIDSEEYNKVFPLTRLNSKNVVTAANGNFLRNADIFEVVDNIGSYKSVGVGGPLTGAPADIGIIDDPVKDSVEAKSAIVQQRNWEWYNDVYLTRLHNDSRQLLTMTRWDENDLAGKILKYDGAENWTILSLPALKEDESNPEDPREVGEALWEEKHSKESILKVRNQSKRTFVALYQQKPRQVSSGGEFFYNFSYSKHVGSVKLIRGYPIHLTFDFNSKPYMTMLLIQVIKSEIGFNIQVFKEYTLKHPRNTTQALCEEFIEHYGDLNPDIFYYGDAMGEKRIEGKGDEKRFDDVRKYLRRFLTDASKRTMGYNVSIIKRKEFVNSVLSNTIEGTDILDPITNIFLSIDESCSETIADFENLLEDKDGEKWKQKISDPDNPQIQYEKHGHTSDALEYLLSYLFKDIILKPRR